ncbi:MAG: hypothetical protein CSA26_04695 [Desulfobacterales bacterium]|nr:MAG: hypothetical protein CSA26_04695 [Desulfobacterales bacterium]
MMPAPLLLILPTPNIIVDIGGLNNTKDIAQSGEDVLRRSQQLKEYADKLKEIVDQFKIAPITKRALDRKFQHSVESPVKAS